MVKRILAYEWKSKWQMCTIMHLLQIDVWMLALQCKGIPLIVNKRIVAVVKSRHILSITFDGTKLKEKRHRRGTNADKLFKEYWLNVNIHSLSNRPHEYHHHFSVSALNGVLKRASQRRRSLRDDKMMEKDKREETSRSESANSEAPTTRLMGGSMGSAYSLFACSL